jgi:hypothetical protein
MSSVWRNNDAPPDDACHTLFYALGLFVAGIALFLLGLVAHSLIGNIVIYPARYAATALFGLLLGMTELISRFRDRPTAPLMTVPGLVYMATNVAASVAALWILQTQDVKYDFGGKLPPALAQVLLAGFGAMIFFRSALFTLRVADSDVAIGPAAVLQIILNAADRACDRLRAGPRSQIIHTIMRGVSFERARVALPLHCFTLMQNVSIVEQTQVMQTIDTIGSKTITDEVKAYNLGLILMNVVGEDVLDRAVHVLGTLILGPASDEPPILAQAQTLSAADATALVDVCIALDPLTRNDKADEIRKEIQTGVSTTQSLAIQNLIVLLRLRERFGATTVARALALVTTRQSQANPVKGPLQAADLDPPAPQPLKGSGGASGTTGGGGITGSGS